MATKLFSKESLAAIKDKKLMIAITAVIFVPVLYAGMFLWAFWDPYDHLEDIPVAIVNGDEGYYYEGEHLTLGDELVDKLKEEPEFDFHFVERQEAYQGLKNEDYYILIEIPHDFSKNSSTLMDDVPDKIEMLYVPNESYNFLASQIGETAMLHIEMALEEKIIETYSETFFDKIDEIADGLVEASDATEELHDGAGELKDGTKEIKDNLATLASKSIEFSEGVGTARSGASDLSAGSAKLADGIGQLNDGSGKLLDASKQVQAGAGQLADGTKAANAGVQEMRGKLPDLVNGTGQLQTGMKQFQNELPKQMADKIGEQLTTSSAKMNEGLDELEEGVLSGVETAFQDGMAPQLSAGLTDELSKQLAENLSQQLSVGLSQGIAQQMVSQQEAQMNQFFDAMEQNGVIDTQQNAILKAQLKQNSPSVDQIAGSLQQGMQSQIKTNLETGLPGAIGPGISKGVNRAVAETLAQLEPGIQDGFGRYKAEVNKGLSAVSDGSLEKQIAAALDPTFNQLNGGISAINQGQKQLQSGVNQLAGGTHQLQEGAKALASGQGEYVSNMEVFRSKFAEANNGTNELASGANKLVDGMLKLEDGSVQLSDGAGKLADGSEKLDEGMDKLVDGTEEFDDKMKQAAEEANDVNATEDTHNMMANPVEVENEKINEVPNYGTGFAPYFLSLGLYVGALLLSIVYPLREPSVIPTSGWSWFLRKFIGLFFIGVFQALIAAGVLLLGLGIEVQSVPLFLLYSIITSLVFITLIQFLVTCLDDPGRFIAIIILILQLTTSAGTFPLELIPKVLQPLNAALPMTYTVAGYKAVISSGEYGVMWQNAGILFIFTIAFMLLTWSYFALMFKRKFGAMQEG